MKLQSAIISSLLALAGISCASNITASDFSGSGASFVQNLVVSTGNLALANGTALVRVGYFSGGVTSELGTSLRSTEKSVVFGAIASNFVPLGETGGDADLGLGAGTATGPRIGQRTVSGSSQAGRLLGQITGVVPTGNPANSFNAESINGVGAGTRIFLMIYNAPTADAATELGIFSGTTWLMPSNNLSNITINAVDVDTDAEVFRGSRGSLVLAPLTVVPEPTTGVMALLAGLGMISRRRR